MKYKSVAKWPAGTCDWHPENLSEDEHDSKEFAFAICKRLHNHGFGGEEKIFPLETWVDEVNGEFKKGMLVCIKQTGMLGIVLGVSPLKNFDWSVEVAGNIEEFKTNQLC